MITIFRLVNNKVQKVEFKDLDLKQISWIRLIKPKEEELEDIENLTKIKKNDLLEVIEDDERSRVEKSNHLHIIYRGPYLEEGDIVTVPFSIFIHKNLIITVENKKIRRLERLQELFDKGQRKFLFKNTIGYFLHYLLLKINDDFLFALDKIEQTAEVIKEKTTELSQYSLEKLYSSNLTLTYFNRTLIANIEVLSILRRSYFKEFNDKDRKRLTDLYYEALQLLDMEKIQREVISNLFNFQSIIASNRLNRFMKLITSLALIIMIPTLITGIFGMNFTYMPFTDMKYGFYYVAAGMAIISAAILGVFKLIDWL